MFLHLLIIFILGFFKSNLFFRKFYFITFNKLKNNYNLKIYIEKTTFTNIQKVTLARVCISIRGRYLVNIEKISLSLRFDRSFKSFSYCPSVRVHVCNSTLKKLFLHNTQKKHNRDKKIVSPLKLVNKVLKLLKVANKKFLSVEINNLSVEKSRNTNVSIFSKDGDFSFFVSHSDEEVKVAGTISLSNHTMVFKTTEISINGILFSASNIEVKSNLVENRCTISLSLIVSDYLKFKSTLKPFEKNLNYFSGKKIALIIRVESDKVEIENGSFIEIENLVIPLKGAIYKSTWPILGILSVIEVNEEIAQRIFSRFKNLIFEGNEKLKFTVSIIFRINILNINEPDLRIALKSDYNLEDKLSCDLSYLNNPFSFFQNMENGPTIRFQFDVEENNSFIPLPNLDSLFLKLIILAEDPNFYSHRGVDTLFFGQAIIQNLKNGKIIRGSSTITMQVVKNLFLSIEKSALRKIEEVSIALLIENFFSIPKKRILELYINLFELGPDVYGLVAGCEFYFSKHPNKLTLTEMLVILYIIPRPLHFYDALKNGSEQLKRNLSLYLLNSINRLSANGTESFTGNLELEPCINFNKQFGKLDISTYLDV